VFDKTGTLTLGLTEGEEQLRDGTLAAVAELKGRGMELWMISGDKREKAERIAGLLGIDNVLCEVKPSDKSDAVKKLQAKGKRVCFVGDGINDSPALACADIGVALGCGTDIAISAADVMLVGSGIASVKTVFDISAATMRNVRQNLIWAVVYNVICIPLAAAGIINPSIAAAAMALSSNGVLLNALRLKNYGK
uniref:HAD-IC family P-type ATPase n=1 Tax=Candidatus Limivicinus sp. TaxID=3030905 RepID=UPI003FF12B55